MKGYLASTEHIDWITPSVKSKAATLALGKKTPFEIARACFEFVRDEIKHSLDYKLMRVNLVD